MSKLPLDLSNFKKVESNEHTSTFQHYAGHKVIIAHKKLSEKMREKLEGIPTVKKAEGGSVHEAYDEDRPGVSHAGESIRQMIPPGTSKTRSEAREDRGFLDKAKSEHHKVLAAIKSSKGKDRKYLAEGGLSEDGEEMPDEVYPDDIDRSPAGMSRMVESGDAGGVPPSTEKAQSKHKKHHGIKPLDPNSPAKSSGPYVAPYKDTTDVVYDPDTSTDPAKNWRIADPGISEPKPEDPEQAQAPMPEPEATEAPVSPIAAPRTFEDHKAATLNYLNNESEDFANALVAGKIKPETYSDLFAKKSTLGKIGSIFGLLVGGAGSGLSKQPNILLHMWDNEIKNDLEAQKASNINAQNFLTLGQQHLMNTANVAKTEAQTGLEQNRAQQLSIDNLTRDLSNRQNILKTMGLNNLTAEEVQEYETNNKYLDQMNQQKLRLQEQGINLSKATEQNTKVTTDSVALATTYTRMLQASLHKQVLAVEKMPDGPQKVAAQQALAVAYGQMQDKIIDAHDKAAIANAMTQTFVGGDNGSTQGTQQAPTKGPNESEEAFQKRMKLYNVIGPMGEKMKTQEEGRRIPGLGSASRPVGPQDIDSWEHFMALQKLYKEGQDYLDKTGPLGEKIPGSMKTRGENIGKNINLTMGQLQDLSRFTHEENGLYRSLVPDFTGTHFTGSDKTAMEQLQKHLDQKINSFKDSLGIRQGQVYKNGKFYQKQGKYMVPVP